MNVVFASVIFAEFPQGRVETEELMPKRIVDGDAWARSRKALEIPIEWRAEPVLWFTLALANGSFDCDARRIWSDLYSFNRPNIQPEHVEQMMVSFAKAKLLFRWRIGAGPVWGFFVNQDAPGRLPPGSRLKRGQEKMGAPVPHDLVAQFMAGEATEKIWNAEECGELGREQQANGKPIASHRQANGKVGFGFGSGLGLGKKRVSARAPQSRLVEAKGFEQFWEIYPEGRRVAKAEARQAWERMQLEMRADEVMAGLLAAKAGEWADLIADGRVRLIPHAATWLRGERWKDEAVMHGGSERKSASEQREAETRRNLERAL